jgi:hypothetical protein
MFFTLLICIVLQCDTFCQVTAKRKIFRDRLGRRKMLIGNWKIQKNIFRLPSLGKNVPYGELENVKNIYG